MRSRYLLRNISNVSFSLLQKAWKPRHSKYTATLEFELIVEIDFRNRFYIFHKSQYFYTIYHYHKINISQHTCEKQLLQTFNIPLLFLFEIKVDFALDRIMREVSVPSKALTSFVTSRSRPHIDLQKGGTVEMRLRVPEGPTRCVASLEPLGNLLLLNCY